MRFKRPNDLCIKITSVSLDIYIEAKTIEEARCVYDDEMEFLWDEYATVDDDKLTEDAIKLKRVVLAMAEPEPTDVITDGHGGRWSRTCPECGRDTMHIVRPGKVQCGECG